MFSGRFSCQRTHVDEEMVFGYETVQFVSLTPILKMESDEIIQWLNYIMLSFSFNILMSFVKIFEFQILIACC